MFIGPDPPSLPDAARQFQGGRKARLLGELGVNLQGGAFLRALVLGEECDFSVLVGPARFAAGHRTLALEDDPLVDDEARSRDVAEDLPRGQELEPLAGRDIAGDLGVHDDRGPGDLRAHQRALADRERVLRRDFALDLPLDAHRALERELAGDPATLAKKRAGPARLLHLGSVALALEHLNLPSHRSWRRHRGFGIQSPGPIEPLAVLAE